MDQSQKSIQLFLFPSSVYLLSLIISINLFLSCHANGPTNWETNMVVNTVIRIKFSFLFEIFVSNFFPLLQHSTDGWQTEEKKISGQSYSRQQVVERQCKYLKMFEFVVFCKKNGAVTLQLYPSIEDCTVTQNILKIFLKMLYTLYGPHVQ